MNGPEQEPHRLRDISLDTSFSTAESRSAQLHCPARLGDGDVFILDDQREHLSTLKEALESLFECSPDSIHTINPLEISHSASDTKGFEIVQATVAPIVAAVASPRPPALVITDFEMKAVTGDQIIRALFERFSGHPPFKIVLSSGNDMSVSLSGYDVFLPKPIRLSVFKSAIHSLFPSSVQ